MLLTSIIIFLQAGFVLCNPHCRYNSDCTSYDCSSEIPFCDHGSCGCIDSCKEGDCLKFLKSCPTYDSSMHNNYQQYCPHNRCQCPSPTTVSTTTTTTEKPTTTSAPLAPGQCNDKGDCYSFLYDCTVHDVHCLDKRCQCLSSLHQTTPKPVCTFSSDCHPLLLTCPETSKHCLDGHCMCLTVDRTAKTTTTTPVYPVCQTSADCDTTGCSGGVLHCFDGTCVCL